MDRKTQIDAGDLTQRLDHMVPDPMYSSEENAKFSAELERLSALLFELLPDKSLSPMERVERLARVVEPREPRLDHLRSASTKVTEIKARVDELVPGDGTTEQKISSILASLDKLVPSEKRTGSVIEKLERLGDPRGKIEPE